MSASATFILVVSRMLCHESMNVRCLHIYNAARAWHGIAQLIFVSLIKAFQNTVRCFNYFAGKTRFFWERSNFLIWKLARQRVGNRFLPPFACAPPPRARAATTWEEKGEERPCFDRLGPPSLPSREGAALKKSIIGNGGGGGGGVGDVRGHFRLCSSLTAKGGRGGKEERSRGRFWQRCLERQAFRELKYSTIFTALTFSD